MGEKAALTIEFREGRAATLLRRSFFPEKEARRLPFHLGRSVRRTEPQPSWASVCSKISKRVSRELSASNRILMAGS